MRSKGSLRGYFPSISLVQVSVIVQPLLESIVGLPPMLPLYVLALNQRFVIARQVKYLFRHVSNGAVPRGLLNGSFDRPPVHLYREPIAN